MSWRSTLATLILIAISGLSPANAGAAETVALWLFDEPIGLYPSCVLEDSSPSDYPLVLGRGGRITPGKYGRALEPAEPPPMVFPPGEIAFGLKPLPTPPGRTVEPMTWANARFCALMTSGENHLRKEVGFVNPADTRLNLGPFDWTVEFWFAPARKAGEDGVVFEIGEGPRGENEKVTRLVLNAGGDSFTLTNQPSGTVLLIPSDARALDPEAGAWRHLAFVYSAAEAQLRHYVDGIEQPLPARSPLKALAHGDEAYLSIGRDGRWERPLPGRIDELRISAGRVYRTAFKPPASFAPSFPRRPLKQGPPLLFSKGASARSPIPLHTRKHLFIDGALIAEMKDCKFVVNPPRKAERVIDHIQGPFRKHLTVVEDEDGVIRIYNAVAKDFLQVLTSTDGVHFQSPDLGRGLIEGRSNIVIPEMVGGLGNPFIDPNGSGEDRWKYFSDYHRRGIYLYTSPDGYTWTRNPTATLPFRSGTQSCTFYDDQRQLYVSYHRSDIFQTPGGATQRSSVVTEHRSLYEPTPFTPLSQEDYLKLRKRFRLRDPLPWYLDNGPLTPGGFGMEFPHKFDPTPDDPVGTDFYITKAQKYPWAPDTYLAFPVAYFHYEADGPETRRILMDPARGRGSGPLETQLAVSRDGLNWKRHPRPAYVGIGEHLGRRVVTAYIAHGMVRRGNEIWQYYFGETQYHSPWKQDPAGRGVYRLVQRLDGFVSIDSPYGKEGLVVTKPILFQGNRLTLNIDTDAVGYAQVGFLDENGNPIEGFSVDDCIYINGDFVETEVEWLHRGKDVSALAGKPVRLVFRMRGAKLYAMQFLER